MNKELKYRVWSNFQKKFIDLKEPSFLLAPSGQFWLATNQGPYKVPNNLGFKIQMSTGFKDQNEKEIYEGDILSIYTWDSQHTNLEVKWLSWGAFNLSGHTEFGPAEIIGNIFENPELLK